MRIVPYTHEFYSQSERGVIQSEGHWGHLGILPTEDLDRGGGSGEGEKLVDKEGF